MKYTLKVVKVHTPNLTNNSLVNGLVDPTTLTLLTSSLLMTLQVFFLVAETNPRPDNKTTNISRNQLSWTTIKTNRDKAQAHQHAVTVRVPGFVKVRLKSPRSLCNQAARTSVTPSHRTIFHSSVRVMTIEFRPLIKACYVQEVWDREKWSKARIAQAVLPADSLPTQDWWKPIMWKTCQGSAPVQRKPTLGVQAIQLLTSRGSLTTPIFHKLERVTDLLTEASLKTQRELWAK